ncbi:MAG: DUF4097 domain-containing protein [Ruminococcaceae bacterium]|nr:DUF4097 domain-containing protein [Oscillospiraceae bacterium]
MKRSTLVWIIIASALFLIGAIVFMQALFMIDFDFSKLSTVHYETRTYEVNESFRNISISTITADVEFVHSEDGNCKVVCLEEEKVVHSVEVKDDTLLIAVNDKREWYDNISIFSFRSPKITVYLPDSEYGSLLIDGRTGDVLIPSGFSFKEVDISATTGDVRCFSGASGALGIEVTTGDIKLEDISAAAVSLSVSTGDIRATNIKCEGDVSISVRTGDAKISDVTCKNLNSDGSTGDIILNGVISSEKINVTRSTGDVRFKDSDASEIFIKVSTGDVEGTLLSEKIFIASTSTGSVKVPQSVSGGRCEIKTSTGDIRISIP